MEPPRRDYLNALDALLVQPPREGVYICCFCEQDDVLSQWRAYGGNGNGVSVQINPNEFVDYTGNQPFGFLSIWNVFYETSQQEEIMKRAIEMTYNKFSAQFSSDQIAKKAKDVIDFFVPTFKHEGFKEECEWRMILAPSLSSKVKPRYRTARDMLIPYYSLKDLVLSQNNIEEKDWRLPIVGVRTGPSRHSALNQGSAQSLLSDNGYNTVQVTPSSTPYRS